MRLQGVDRPAVVFELAKKSQPERCSEPAEVDKRELNNWRRADAPRETGLTPM